MLVTYLNMHKGVDTMIFLNTCTVRQGCKLYARFTQLLNMGKVSKLEQQLQIIWHNYITYCMINSFKHWTSLDRTNTYNSQFFSPKCKKYIQRTACNTAMFLDVFLPAPRPVCSPSRYWWPPNRPARCGTWGCGGVRPRRWQRYSRVHYCPGGKVPEK